MGVRDPQQIGDSESIENRVVGGGKDHVFGLVQVDSKGFMGEPRTDEFELIIID